MFLADYYVFMLCNILDNIILGISKLCHCQIIHNNIPILNSLDISTQKYLKFSIHIHVCFAGLHVILVKDRMWHLD